MASLSPSSSSTTSSNSDTDISPPTTPRTRIAFPSLAFSRSSAFKGALNMPLKSPPSPPTITLFPTADISSFATLPTQPSPPMSSLSPTSSPFSGSSTLFSTNSPYAHCAYPSWPRSDSLSPSSSSTYSSSSSSILSAESYNFTTSSSTPSSYISDEDLEDLATLPLYNNIRIPPEFLVAATPVSETAMEKERRRPRSKRVMLPPDIQTASIPLAQDAKSGEDGSKTRNRRRSSPLKRRKLVLGLSPVQE